MSDMFDILSSMKGSDYTLEEIEQAEKMMKKNGGSLAENLVKLTGRQATLPKTTFSNGIMDALTQQIKDVGRMTESLKGSNKKADASVSAMNETLMQNSAMLDEQLKELNSNLAKDFGIGETRSDGSVVATPYVKKSEEAAALQPQILEGEDALDAFKGIADAVGEKVYGQSEFIKKLVIAFKRPYVMPPEGNRAKNSIFISGRNDTGRHYALSSLTAVMKEKKLLSSDEITIVDLGLYPDAAMEKIFLQDMYSALSGAPSVILFERFENCHPSFLGHISDLVTEGSFKLSERYVLQNGQLVNVQNSLASEAVSAFDAKGKYLVFITEKSLDKAAGIMGAPFIDGLGDICKTEELDKEAIRKVAEREQQELPGKAEKQFYFKISFDEAFLDYAVSRSEKQAGLKGVQDFYDSVLQALAQARLEGDYDKGTELKLFVEENRIYAQNGEEKIDLSALLPTAYKGEADEIRKELDEIVGLTEIKEYVLGLEEYYKVQQRRAEAGLKTAELSKHMIFTGSPGTGKTTIARIISKYLKSIGVLSGGQLIEVSRADLVGRFVGHTAPLTNKVIGSAIGGVLFIDEAYSLYRGKDDSFGLEAIDTLVKGIEDNRENLIVILAGYSNEMQEFLTSNSGLKSRFPNVINFPDYTGEELLKIARSIAKSKGYVIDEGADAALTMYFNGVQMTRAADAGNGRLARNMVEEAILNQSRRLVAEPDAEMSTLMLSDFDMADTEA